jgi:hypothetical protein
MENKIEKLKTLNKAHDIAQYFDYVPNKERSNTIAIVYDICSFDEANSICDIYEGWSPDDVMLNIKNLIKEL